MENHESLKRQNSVLNHLCLLPRKIVQLHGTDNVTEFVLHELCHENCFNLTRAAYFVDNPDFNCTKGVAGFSRDDAYTFKSLWEDPVAFSKHMEASVFNKKVRQMEGASTRKSGDAHQRWAENVAKNLGFKNYAFCSWPIKYDNEGFMVFEKADEKDTLVDMHGEHGFSLLGFCPIF